MLLLAADTSGKQGSIALAECDAPESCVIVEVVALSGGAFSAQLVPQIAGLLEKHRRSKRDLGAFAVASGPGSFTGLRVGLAAMKALAEALQKPIAAISLLEAVACSGTARGSVLAALDAGRGDVYVGDYELDSHVPRRAQMRSERLLSREEFVGDVARAAATGKTIVTPDAGLAEASRAAGVAAGQLELIEYPDSAVIARLGWEHIQQGRTVDPEELEANYIRHSDAIFSKPRP
jgi:tRNA threonylcarbamoyladenosine biosynthesis protein TsaB